MCGPGGEEGRAGGGGGGAFNSGDAGELVQKWFLVHRMGDIR